MTEHRISEEDLHAFIDGRLDGRRNDTVRAYLATHPEQAEIVAAYSADRQMLRDALRTDAQALIPPSLNVRHMVEARRRNKLAQWRLPMAASIALAAGLGAGWLIRSAALPAPNGVATLAREAADNYRVYAYDANRPVEIAATDKAKLVRWVSNRLQRPVAAPNLDKAGFRLIGGRLVTTPHGPAAMFIYDGAPGQRLAVMIRPMAIDKQTRMSEHAEDGLGGVSWADNGMGYSLVGPVSARELHPLADEVRRELRGSI